MKQSERDKKEKEVRAWMEELDKLHELRREKEIIDLPNPIFRGYLLSFTLTHEGEKFMSDRHKELFYMNQPRFFIKDKREAKNIKPNLENSMFGDYFKDPDNQFYSSGFFWPLVITTRNGEIIQPFDIPKSQEIKSVGQYFKPIKEVDLFGTKIGYHALKISEEYFTVQRKKYKQKRAWVEDAHIESRLDYLNRKLFEEKNWHKYGPDTSSYQREPGKQPEGLYHSNYVGMSPALPYKRSTQKEQTQTLIQKNIKENGTKSNF